MSKANLCEHAASRTWHEQKPGTPYRWEMHCSKCRRTRKLTTEKAGDLEARGETIVHYPPRNIFAEIMGEPIVAEPAVRLRSDRRRSIAMKCDCEAGTAWVAQSAEMSPAYHVLCRNCGAVPRKYPARFHSELKQLIGKGEDLTVIRF
jgi:hypothetical protein